MSYLPLLEFLPQLAPRQVLLPHSLRLPVWPLSAWAYRKISVLRIQGLWRNPPALKNTTEYIPVIQVYVTSTRARVSFQ